MQKLTKQEINRMFKTASRVFRHPAFDVLAEPVGPPSASRGTNFSPESQGRLVVVTPGHIGNAVQRNKIRRRLKALFAKHQVAPMGKDLIIVAKKPSVSLEFEKVEHLFMRVLDALQNLRERKSV